MIDYVMMRQAKEILERELIKVIRKKCVNIDTELACDYYFDWLRSIGSRKQKAYTKGLEKRVFQSRKEAIKQDREPLGYNEIIALDVLNIFVAERKNISYSVNKKGIIEFERAVLEEKSKTGTDKFEEDTQELPSIDDLY